MKKRFLIRIVLFLIPVMLVLVGAEAILRAIPNDYSYKNTYLEHHAEEVEVLILGNSHFYRGVVPEEIDLHAFNAAYISQSLDMDLLIFNKFKPKLTNLKVLVLGISYPTLFSKLEDGKEKWRLKNYNLYYHFNHTLDPKNYSELLSNTFDMNKRHALNYYKRNKKMIQSSPFGGGAMSEQRDIVKTGKEAAKRHTKLLFPYYKEYVSTIDKVILWAEQNKCIILFVTPPYSQTYIEHLNQKQLNIMNTVLDSITTHHTNVYRLNAMKETRFKENKNFKDGDHLNKKGAKIFTALLSKKLDSIDKVLK